MLMEVIVLAMYVENFPMQEEAGFPAIDLPILGRNQVGSTLDCLEKRYERGCLEQRTIGF